MTDQELMNFGEIGKIFEQKLVLVQEKVRKETAKKLDSRLINCRIYLASLFTESLEIRSGIGGKADKDLGKIIHLVASYVQGFGITEDLIFCGQYTKASAAIKHEYEILTRIYEIKNKYAKEGGTPNVKYAPKGSQILYGKLNEISHPSKSDIISKLLRKKYNGISPFPQYIQGYARSLYESHLYIGYEILKLNLLLLDDLYDNQVISELERKGYFDYFTILKQNLVIADIIEGNDNNNA